ncbi:MAG: SAM-dependent methyltransferase [Proteobacteria bacterium]|nr:SAM-dependent methyltransferase [Pseudomonadota bacterium]MBU1743014.1 SAM-dependent methyltransferase [Pseudomonadota bacterium]
MASLRRAVGDHRALMVWLCAVAAALLVAASARAVPEGKVSATAVGACLYRAIGALDPDLKTRNPDYLAVKFFAPFYSRKEFQPNFARAMRWVRYRKRLAYYYVTARTRHFDAILERELRAGATQVVILGAGFDSRAFRFHRKFPRVKFFELDLPATQSIKRRLTRERIGPPPPTLVYTPIDFNTQTLGQALARAGYNPRARTVFIWEGVTYYITAGAVDSTLRFIARKSGPGSSVIFDYALEEVIKGDFRRFPYAQYAIKRLASINEPFLFGIRQDRAAEYVAQRGLRLKSDLGAAELTRRYLITSRGSVFGPLPGYMRIMHAVVPASGPRP